MRFDIDTLMGVMLSIEAEVPRSEILEKYTLGTAQYNHVRRGMESTIGNKPKYAIPVYKLWQKGYRDPAIVKMVVATEELDAEEPERKYRLLSVGDVQKLMDPALRPENRTDFLLDSIEENLPTVRCLLEYALTSHGGIRLYLQEVNRASLDRIKGITNKGEGKDEEI